jgi:hypothetical protein
MNDKNDKSTPKRVFMNLWALETLQRKRRLVVEVPAECNTDDLQELSGVTLDQWAIAASADPEWEYGDVDGFEVEEIIYVEDGVPDHLTSDLILIRDEAGRLVPAEQE